MSGILELPNGDSYAGDFKDGLYDGYSLYKCKNGDTYCGDFAQGKRNGQGILKLSTPSGTVLDFIGSFTDDVLTHGQHKDEFGTYLGQFAIQNGRPISHGKGMLQFTNGDIYDGNWSQG